MWSVLILNLVALVSVYMEKATTNKRPYKLATVVSNAGCQNRLPQNNDKAIPVI